jgi:hypothetical protein
MRSKDHTIIKNEPPSPQTPQKREERIAIRPLLLLMHKKNMPKLVGS